MGLVLMDRRLPCGACGTWTCARCGRQRHGASLAYPDHNCARCGSTEGTMKPTRHGSVRGIYEDHNPVTGPVCATWHHDDLTVPWAGPCEHKSCRAIAWHDV